MDKKRWLTPGTPRTGSQLPPGEPASDGYVTVNDSQNYHSVTGFNGPWLNSITSLGVGFFDPFNIHPNWSDLSIGR